MASLGVRPVPMSVNITIEPPGLANMGASIPSWGILLIFAAILSMGVRGYAETTSSAGASGDRSKMDLLLNPAGILTIAGEAVVSRVDQLFEGVIDVGKELSESIVVIRQSLEDLASLLRTFFKMVTSFVISFQKMLQGLVGSALNIVTVIKGILASLMDTMTVLVYTITTSMNLVGSVENGPPGRAMRAMVDVINSL